MPPGENIKDAAVATSVSWLHSIDGDVAGVVVGGGELHIGFLVADVNRHGLLVDQKRLGLLVDPAHLADGVTRRRGDVAAEQERVACLCGQTGRSYNLT